MSTLAKEAKDLADFLAREGKTLAGIGSDVLAQTGKSIGSALAQGASLPNTMTPSSWSQMVDAELGDLSPADLDKPVLSNAHPSLENNSGQSNDLGIS